MRHNYIIIVVVCIISLAACSDITNDAKEKEEHQQVSKNESAENVSLLSPERVLNIAHRGASGYAPEHTMYSYQLAEELQGDYLEIDLQMTKDGELIAMHDDNVERTTDGDGDVNELTMDDIKVLDAGAWFNEEFPDMAEPVFSNAEILTLGEIFDEFGKSANYYIETKIPDESPGMVKELVTVLNEYGMLEDDMKEGQIIIQSFSEASLLEVQELAPALPLIQLISYNKPADITDDELDFISSYAVGIGANYKYISEDYAQSVRQRDLLLHPYTVNEKEDMKRMIAWGATGMFTNYPDRLAEVKDEYGKD